MSHPLDHGSQNAITTHALTDKPCTRTYNILIPEHLREAVPRYYWLGEADNVEGPTRPVLPVPVVAKTKGE